MAQFTLQKQSKPKAKPPGAIRVKPQYYWMLCDLKERTGIPIGNIVEQCIDFALEHAEIKAPKNYPGLLGQYIKVPLLEERDDGDA